MLGFYAGEYERNGMGGTREFDDTRLAALIMRL